MLSRLQHSVLESSELLHLLLQHCSMVKFPHITILSFMWPSFGDCRSAAVLPVLFPVNTASITKPPTLSKFLTLGNPTVITPQLNPVNPNEDTGISAMQLRAEVGAKLIMKPQHGFSWQLCNFSLVNIFVLKDVSFNLKEKVMQKLRTCHTM